jgi:hypothetical protein
MANIILPTTADVASMPHSIGFARFTKRARAQRPSDWPPTIEENRPPVDGSRGMTGNWEELGVSRGAASLGVPRGFGVASPTSVCRHGERKADSRARHADLIAVVALTVNRVWRDLRAGWTVGSSIGEPRWRKGHWCRRRAACVL